MRITRIAATDAELLACHQVLRELRPHLDARQFLAQVRRQQAAGYVLVFLEDDGQVQSVAGFRVSECLAWGRFLYVDDLVTTDRARSRGYGGQLLQWLVAEARRQGCAEFHLDSGVQRHDAHRFYGRNGLEITCQHFALRL